MKSKKKKAGPNSNFLRFNLKSSICLKHISHFPLELKQKMIILGVYYQNTIWPRISSMFYSIKVNEWGGKKKGQILLLLKMTPNPPGSIVNTFTETKTTKVHDEQWLKDGRINRNAGIHLLNVVILLLCKTCMIELI